jgi:hypothetical protein
MLDPLELIDLLFLVNLPVYDPVGVAYLLRDEYVTNTAAGAVDGTAAEPGPGGNRHVTDTDGDALSISDGALAFANPNDAWHDPGVYYDALSRVAGRVMLGEFDAASGNRVMVGWSSVAGGNHLLNGHGVYLENPISDLFVWSTTGVLVGSVSTDTLYRWAVVLRSLGAYFFIKGGAFTEWTLLWLDEPVPTWLPKCLAYDSFTRSDGALGSSEASGPDGQAVAERAWTFDSGIWTVDTHQAKSSPNVGSEIVDNGDMELDSDWYGRNSPPTNERSDVQKHGGTYSRHVVVDAQYEGCYQNVNVEVDTWHQVQAWVYGNDRDIQVGYFANEGSWLGKQTVPAAWTEFVATFRVPNTASSDFVISRSANAVTDADFYTDDFSLKPLTLSELLASVDDAATADVVVSVELTISQFTQAGVVLNLDDASDPANFVIGTYDRQANLVKLEKCVAGVYTQVIGSGKTYVEGAALVVVKEGTSYYLYYNNVKVGSTSTISDAGIVDNTKHGLFSTYSGNRLDNFTLFPRGSGGEFGRLNRY